MPPTDTPPTSSDRSPEDGAAATAAPTSFIHQIIEQDVASGRWGPPGDASVVRTRFPPEPNGYLHIGHAKSITLNFGLAQRYGGACNLRFDDTNPEKEEAEYVRSIEEDVRWLGFEPAGGVRYASDYFDRMYEWALELIGKGLAYVDEQDHETIRRQRGDLQHPGTPSPFRDRPAGESVAQFERMKRGEVGDGAMVLRAKIDMASPNMNMRDPVMYRVVNKAHHRLGDRYHIYPMYDWAHGLEDSIEGITHSICTLEFEDHRPLYDWFIDAINRDRGLNAATGAPIHHPQQVEFARFNVNYCVMSKRYMKQLVDEKIVGGWDDPRMITISGYRRRGYTAEAIRRVMAELGTTKYNALHDMGVLERGIREDLNRRAPRRMAVLRPLKVTITNWSEHGEADRVETMRAVNNPEDENAGAREVPFGGTLYVERDDFMVDAPRKWFRLAPGREVRLRYGYWVTCHDVVEEGGEVIELLCTYDPLTKGGDNPPPDEEGKVRKVKGTLHWVAAATSAPITVRLFDRLYERERPGKATGNHLDDLNPRSLEVVEGALLEPNWRTTEAERAAGTGAWTDGVERFQFERQGYFCVDARETDTAGRPVFNRTVTLKDSWAREAGK